MPTQIRKINEPIDHAQHVIGRHELVEAKSVEKALLRHEPIAHHRPNPPAATTQENHSDGPVASTFSTKSRGEQPWSILPDWTSRWKRRMFASSIEMARSFLKQGHQPHLRQSLP